MTSSTEWDLESIASSTSSSASSFDEDEVNARISPYWTKYRSLIERRGFQLDTVRDVKEYYQRHCSNIDKQELHTYLSGYHRALARSDEDALCKDAGLRDGLFRATRGLDGLKVMVKAVHRDSRELDIVRYLSAPAQQRDPMNHCIPILDLIDMPQDDICFIVMEEWSRNMFPEAPFSLRYLLVALHHCIEHIAFMHRHHIAHLDISLHNFLTNYNGRYACIDYELSHRIDKASSPWILCSRGTEMPPEVERGRPSNPFMVDVWALGILILRACKLAGIHVPELMHLAKSMLNENPDKRPPAAAVLKEFQQVVATMGETCHICP
ncbi:kinase-like protein [Rhizopogon vinicolor AM-OR11-026]|uniref:Kinase-like protein n=1 Tax=Rhizopogon vinicolor AM-OR11-026 TaxID=1314800 RepID=A0A1B7NIE2_9AGAM|nr:kinase-like protein [Rhizopogon vinicolor AM-OR11-026]